MNKHIISAAALMIAAATVLPAQNAKGSGIKVRKDAPSSMDMPAASMATSANPTVQTTPEWYHATTCAPYDTAAARKVAIKSDLYTPGSMISPDSAKAIALCAVPGQVTSGEMEKDNGMVHYSITVIPNKKKTHAKVTVDATTGAVLDSKQFGGLRGVAGWVRESAEHKMNKKP